MAYGSKIDPDLIRQCHNVCLSSSVAAIRSLGTKKPLHAHSPLYVSFCSSLRGLANDNGTPSYQNANQRRIIDHYMITSSAHPPPVCIVVNQVAAIARFEMKHIDPLHLFYIRFMQLGLTTHILSKSICSTDTTGCII